MDLLVARIARRMSAERARADRWRARLPACARLLHARGATRVVLFGSLATGAPPHDATDVDLAVWGLSDREIIDVVLDLEELLGASVDLVAVEAASPSLAACIARDGVEVR